MSLPGFLTSHDLNGGAGGAVRPAATVPRRCAEEYDRCMENCAFWPDPGACACYCQNDLCSCVRPGCPRQRCE